MVSSERTSMAETVDNSRYRAISLLRLSTDEQAAEGRAGLLRQKEEIRIATTRWGLEICKRYEIIDVSGTVIQQSPIFQEVIAQLQNPSVHGIVVSDLSRLMRPDDFSSFGIYDFFAKNRKLIFTPSSVFDLTDDAGFLQAGI